MELLNGRYAHNFAAEDPQRKFSMGNASSFYLVGSMAPLTRERHFFVEKILVGFFSVSMRAGAPRVYARNVSIRFENAAHGKGRSTK